MKPLIALAVMLTSSAAHALTCAPPDPARSFATAQAAPETYILLRGHLRVIDPRALQSPTDPQNPGPVSVWFTGASLTTQGFTQPFESLVVVQPTCAGQWCGGITRETDVIAFARLENGTHILTASACGNWIFPDDPATAATLTACIRGEACEPGASFH